MTASRKESPTYTTRTDNSCAYELIAKWSAIGFGLFSEIRFPSRNYRCASERWVFHAGMSLTHRNARRRGMSQGRRNSSVAQVVVVVVVAITSFGGGGGIVFEFPETAPACAVRASTKRLGHSSHSTMQRVRGLRALAAIPGVYAGVVAPSFDHFSKREECTILYRCTFNITTKSESLLLPRAIPLTFVASLRNTRG